MKRISVKQDENHNQYFDLSDFEDIVDISKVFAYNLEKINEQLVLTFFDKDGTQLPVKKD